MKSKLFVNSSKYANLSLLQNNGVLLIEVIPISFTNSPFFNSILSPSIFNSCTISFTFTFPFNFVGSTDFFVLNSLGL